MDMLGDRLFLFSGATDGSGQSFGSVYTTKDREMDG
jgi:hypothetical protein